MTIIYTDGSTLDASILKIDGAQIIADDYRIIELSEIEAIED